LQISKNEQTLLDDFNEVLSIQLALYIHSHRNPQLSFGVRYSHHNRNKIIFILDWFLNFQYDICEPLVEPARMSQ
jgi:hypothetical protein